LEGETKRWGVRWDVVGLAETWLDAESEKGVGMEGYGVVCASRKEKRGGGVAVFVREGLTYKTRPDLGVFDEGKFESVFVEIIRGRGRRNDVVGVVYRPPGASPGEFSEVLVKMAQVLTKLRGVNGYIMGDFNVDLIKSGTHGPSGEFLGGFTSGGFYPLVSLPTRLASGTLIDNIFTNNLEDKIEAGLVTVEVSDHLPIFAMVGGSGGGGQDEGPGRDQRRRVTEERMADFVLVLESWDWRESRAVGVGDNVARFRNEFRDVYNEVFPLTEDKRKPKDKEKPWLDDPQFKAMIREKGELFSRKVK